MRILVTGATGFIGRECCRQSRQRGGTPIPLSLTGGEWCAGQASTAHDLATPPAPQLLEGLDAVIHCAGIAHQRAAQQDYERLNVQGTLALARAAAGAGVPRFIYVSSVKAMGPPADERARSERELSEPTDAYGASKLRAEQGLAQTFADAAMAVAIVRPALVYGPGARGNLDSLARAAGRGLPRPPARGGRSMIGRDDLVRLLLDLAEDCPAGVHTWIATDGEAYSTRRLYDALRGAAGAAPTRSWLPLSGWRLACAVLDTMRGGEGGTYTKLFGSEYYSNAALRGQRHWQPSMRFEDCAADVLRAAG